MLQETAASACAVLLLLPSSRKRPVKFLAGESRETTMLKLKQAALILASAAAYASCAAAENGVSAGEIVIGQSASLTGTNAETGLQVRDGANAYFALVNRNGGIHGRKIRMIS